MFFFLKKPSQSFLYNLFWQEFSCLSVLFQNNHAEKYLSESSLEQLEQEKDKLLALVGEFRVLCKQGNFKMTKWEGTFANALQEVSQILANVTNQATDTFKGESNLQRNPLTTSFSVSWYGLIF